MPCGQISQTNGRCLSPSHRWLSLTRPSGTIDTSSTALPTMNGCQPSIPIHAIRLAPVAKLAAETLAYPATILPRWSLRPKRAIQDSLSTKRVAMPIP